MNNSSIAFAQNWWLSFSRTFPYRKDQEVKKRSQAATERFRDDEDDEDIFRVELHTYKWSKYRNESLDVCQHLRFLAEPSARASALY